MTMGSLSCRWMPDESFSRKVISDSKVLFSSESWIARESWMDKIFHVYLLWHKLFSHLWWILLLWCLGYGVGLSLPPLCFSLTLLGMRLLNKSILWEMDLPWAWVEPPLTYFFNYSSWMRLSISFLSWHKSYVWCPLTLWNLHHRLGSGPMMYEFKASEGMSSILGTSRHIYLRRVFKGVKLSLGISLRLKVTISLICKL